MYTKLTMKQIMKLVSFIFVIIVLTLVRMIAINLGINTFIRNLILTSLFFLIGSRLGYFKVSKKDKKN